MPGKIRGHTLLEMLVAMLIFSIVLGIVFFFLVRTMQRVNKAEMKANEGEAAQRLLAQIEREIKSARTITEANMTKLSFLGDAGQTVTWEAEDGQILRNGVSQAGDQRRQYELEFSYLSNDSTLIRSIDEPKGSLVELEKDPGGSVIQFLDKISLVRLEIKTKASQDSISLRGAVSLVLTNKASTP
jgi:prepilin-type N-terminal cleavage/methylation domain-containing protein